jgi:hypothetical protein
VTHENVGAMIATDIYKPAEWHDFFMTTGATSVVSNLSEPSEKPEDSDDLDGGPPVYAGRQG